MFGKDSVKGCKKAGNRQRWTVVEEVPRYTRAVCALGGWPCAKIKGMRDNLYTGVERAFSAAAKHRDVVAKIKHKRKQILNFLR